MEKIKDAEYEVIFEKKIETLNYPCFVLIRTDGNKLLIPYEDVKDIQLSGTYNINGNDVDIYKMIFTNNTLWQLPLEDEQIANFKKYKGSDNND